jgi:hypothetical protein
MARAGLQHHKKKSKQKYESSLYTTLFVINDKRHVSAIKSHIYSEYKIMAL